MINYIILNAAVFQRLQKKITVKLQLMLRIFEVKHVALGCI